MKHDSRHTKAEALADRAQPARDRNDVSEPRPERRRRIGAAQMAAPSTRTWRRAGRFSSSGSSTATIVVEAEEADAHRPMAFSRRSPSPR